jgi:putative acetyltransferase
MPRSRPRTRRSGSAPGSGSLLSVRVVRTAREVASARRLVVEYVRGLGVDLAFQGIDEELSSFPGPYSPPAGRLLLARWNGRPVGCAAVRAWSDAGACEMKRLYVRPGFQGRGIGRRLALASLRAARAAGYEAMRLDTLGSMAAAIALYRSIGFREVPAYRFNPLPNARYFELRFEERSRPPRPRRPDRARDASRHRSSGSRGEASAPGRTPPLTDREHRTARNVGGPPSRPPKGR